ncbi:MAG: hypothetical protein IKH38_02795 [Clostridia bacterium]|nr:hypothetical protein [Clostridia bacterium]
MKSYREIVKGYERRQRDTLVDSIATSLTYADEIAVDSGILEETGLMAELTSSVCTALPFVIIAATEGAKVILGRKPGKLGVHDGAFRAAKTGAALGVGALLMPTLGVLGALPATLGVRVLMDRYKSRLLTGRRLKARTERLTALREQLEQRDAPKEPAPKAIPGELLRIE